MLKCLKSLKDYSIHYNVKNILRAYCDEDFAGNEIKRRSTSEYTVVLGDSYISWKLITQKKYSLFNHRSEIFKYNKMYKTNYMDKKISK